LGSAAGAGNNLFLFVDGELVVEMLDRKPLNKYGRVGLGVYASKIFFRDFKVYKPFVKNLKLLTKNAKQN
jgi:hypothetical protein